MYLVPSWSNPDTQKGLEYGFCIVIAVLTVGTEPAVLYLWNTKTRLTGVSGVSSLIGDYWKWYPYYQQQGWHHIAIVGEKPVEEIMNMWIKSLAAGILCGNYQLFNRLCAFALNLI